MPCLVGALLHMERNGLVAGPVHRRSDLEGRPVVIGTKAWIAGGAIILPRVVIEDDAIVGAGAVVTRDVGTGTTVVENPGRLIV